MGCNSSSLAGGVAPSKPPKAAAPASAPANDSSTSAVTSGGDPDALQKLAAVSSSVLDPAERVRARAVFDKLAEGADFIESSQLPKLLEALFGATFTEATPSEQAAAIADFKKASDGSGRYFFKNILKTILANVDENFVANLRAEFAAIDRDGSGTLSPAEIAEFFTSKGQGMTKDQAMKFVKKFDVNGDGAINVDEFLDMIVASPLSAGIGNSMASVLARAFIQVEEDENLQDVKRELLEMFDMFSKDGALPVANALKVVNAQGFEVDDATLADIREMHDLPADAYSIQQWLVFAIEVMIRPQAEGSRPAEDKAFAEARRAFSMFDVDDDGFVSIEEITELVNKVDAGNGAEATAGDRDEATELIKKMDRTNDGKVNLSEFILYAMSSDIHTRSKSFARDLSMLDKEV